VDVNSGVKNTKGTKDKTLLKEFVKQARYGLSFARQKIN